MGSRGFRIAVTVLVVIGCGFASNESTYKNWLEDDVRDIITSGEAAGFRSLTNDEERDQFIETFWYNLDPTPETFENEFKLEHYRRIVLANQKFGITDIPGRKTDRGRIYIRFGPPDQISNETDPSGVASEAWNYRKSANFLNGATLRFVDQCRCGNPRLTFDEQSKDDLLSVRSTLPGVTPIPIGTNGIQLYIGPSPHPTVHFKALESALNTKITVGSLPFTVEHVKDEPATDSTFLTSVCIDMSPSTLTSVADGSTPARADLFGRVLSLTGRVVAAFETKLTLAQTSDNPLRTCQTLPLNIGLYRLDVAVKDTNSNRLGIRFTELRVGIPAKNRFRPRR
jgi:GWxTD domain-containing protein